MARGEHPAGWKRISKEEHLLLDKMGVPVFWWNINYEDGRHVPWWANGGQPLPGVCSNDHKYPTAYFIKEPDDASMPQS